MINKYKVFIFISLITFTGLGIVLGFLNSKEPVPPLLTEASAITPKPLQQPVINAGPEIVTPTPQPTPPQIKPQITKSPPAVATKPTTTPKPTKITSQSNTVEPAAPLRCGGSFTQEFLCLLNEYRSSKGKGKLSYDTAMANVALSYSTSMNSTGIFSHTDQNGFRFTNRCSEAGISCLAENLAVDFDSPTNLLELWKASGSHNQNLLGPYTSIGLGIKGGYATLLFK